MPEVPSHSPAVSIGIPVYNGEDTLRSALDSLLAQTFMDYEIIVSDNASTDGTAAICVEYQNKEPRLRYLRQGENAGAYANFSAVLRGARGEFFMWAADDDLWSPDFIECMLASLEGVDTAFSDMETIFYCTDERVVSKMPVLDPVESLYVNAKRFLNNLQPSIIYGLHRTQALKAVFSPEQIDFFDCLISFRMLLRGGIRTVPGVRYFAGVQTEQYVPKVVAGAGRRLSYLPVVRNMVGEILANKNLSLSQKAKLVFLVFRTYASVKSHLDINYFGDRGMLLGPAISLKNALRRIKYGSLSYFENGWSGRSKKRSYSQAGEDLILKFALDAMGISEPSYLDIGAHHPFKYSNTYLFYSLGSSGVNVEPDPNLFGILKNKRPRDTNINCAVAASSSSELTFYIMSPPTLNTLLEREALRLERLGQAKIVKTTGVPIREINDLFSLEMAGKAPDILSIDVEGLDLEITRSIDFQRFRPKALCIETLSYSGSGEEIKSNEIKNFMESHGYISYADTYINTIFVDAASWKLRGK